MIQITESHKLLERINYIMKDIDKINFFITTEQYDKRNDILGIVFYGSSKYKTATSKSDINLLIITYNNRCYKGVKYIGDTKIEFSEKGFDNLLIKVEEIEKSQNNSLISILNNGTLIYGD